MATKSIVCIEVQKNENIFSFNMPVGVKYGEAYDAAFEVLEEILRFSSKAVDSAKRPEDSSQGLDSELL